MKIKSIIGILFLSVMAYGQCPTPAANPNSYSWTCGQVYTGTINFTGAISSGITGVWAAANGGTGQSSYTIGDIIYASGATTLSKLAGVATGNALISGGVATAPSWGKITLTGHVSGTLPIANGGTNITTYTTGDILYASAANTLSKLAVGTNGDVLTLAAGVPSWAAPAPSVGGLILKAQSTSTTGSADTIYYYNVTADSDTLTLDGSPSDNDRIGAVLSATSGTNTLLIARNGSTIGGIAADVTLYVAGDGITLQHISGDWVLTSNTIKLHYTTLERTTAQTISGFTTIDFNSEVNDQGGLGDIVNNWIIPRRTGNYQIVITGSIDWEVNDNINTYIYKNGVALREYNMASAINSNISVPLSTIEQLTATDTIEVLLWENFAADPATKTDDRRIRINFYEIP